MVYSGATSQLKTTPQFYPANGIGNHFPWREHTSGKPSELFFSPDKLFYLHTWIDNNGIQLFSCDKLSRLKYNTNQWNYALGSHLDHISDRSVVQNVTVPKINNDYFAVNYDNHQVDRAKELGKRYIKIEEGLTGGNSEVITCWNNGQTIDKLQPSIVP